MKFEDINKIKELSHRSLPLVQFTESTFFSIHLLGYLEMNDLGCFQDLDDGAKGFLSLDSHQYESNDMTVNMCIHSCFQQGKMIFI